MRSRARAGGLELEDGAGIYARVEESARWRRDAPQRLSGARVEEVWTIQWTTAWIRVGGRPSPRGVLGAAAEVASPALARDARGARDVRTMMPP